MQTVTWKKIQGFLDISSGAAIGLLFWITLSMGLYGFFRDRPIQDSWLMFYGMVIGGKTVHSVSRVVRGPSKPSFIRRGE